MKFRFRKETLLILLIVVFPFVTTSVYGAERESDYMPIYDIEEETGYMGVDGLWHKEYRQGFRSRNDLTDPRVLCWREDGCEDVLTYDISDYEHLNGSTVRFKIFLAPGTVAFDVQPLLERDVQVCAYVAFGHAPQYEHPDWKSIDFSHESLPPEGWDFKRLKEREIYSPNRGGHINLLYGRFRPPITEEEAGWIYIRLKTFNNSRISIWKLKNSHYVSVPEYVEWYKSMTEEDWEAFGNPNTVVIDGGTVDNGYGDDDGTTGGTSDGDNSSVIGGGDSGDNGTGGSGDSSSVTGGGVDNGGNYTTPSNNNSIGLPSADQFVFPGSDQRQEPSDNQNQQPSDGSSTDDCNSSITGGPDCPNNTDPPDYMFSASARTGLKNMHQTIVRQTCTTCISHPPNPEIDFQNTLNDGTAVYTYAAVKKSKLLYIAKMDINNQCQFILADEDRPMIESVVPYGTMNISGTWKPDIFNCIQMNNTFFEEDVTFYLGVVPIDQETGVLQDDVSGVAIKLQ